MLRVQRSSELAAPAGEVWAAATDQAGINGELKPLLRMTMPARVRGVPLDEFPIGSPVGRSWILLFGLIPVDYDDLCLVELEPPRRFRERSKTLMFGLWEHERTVEPSAGDGCVVTDRLGFTLKPPLYRVPGAAAAARAVVGFLFGHRHRRLRARDRNRDTPAP